VTVKNVSVLFGIFSVAETAFKMWNLSYQQVIHNAEIFVEAHLRIIFVAI
jgi:hypothetical protein